MAENLFFFLLINAVPRLNAGLEKSPGQNCRILNKRRGRLIGKIRYINRGVVLCVEINTVEFNYLSKCGVSCQRCRQNSSKYIKKMYAFHSTRYLYFIDG